LDFINDIPTNQQTDKALVTSFKHRHHIKYLSLLCQRFIYIVLGVCCIYFKNAERIKDAVMAVFEELNNWLWERIMLEQ
jgi:hypothetical protein